MLTTGTPGHEVGCCTQALYHNLPGGVRCFPPSGCLCYARACIAKGASDSTPPGSWFPMICIKCNTLNPDGSRFCSQCGVFMTIVPEGDPSRPGETPTVGTGGLFVPAGSSPADSLSATTASTMAGTSPGLLMGI